MEPASRSVYSILVVAAHARWVERIAATVGAPAMLLVPGALQFLTVWLFSRANGPQPSSDRQHHDPEPRNSKRRFGLRVIAEAPHLRHLVALVLLGCTSAALLDYLFKAKAVEAIGSGDQFLRLFAPYYAAISLLTLSLVLPIAPLQIAFRSLHS